MGSIVDILLDNFIYIAIVGVLLILGLIGYIVESSNSKGNKVTSGAQATNIPLPKVDPNVTLGSNPMGPAPMNIDPQNKQ